MTVPSLKVSEREAALLEFAAQWESTDGWWLAGSAAENLLTLTSVTDYYKSNKPQAGALGVMASRLARRKLLERRTWANGTRTEYRATDLGRYALALHRSGEPVQ